MRLSRAFLILLPTSLLAEARIEPATWRDTPAWKLHNEHLEAIVVPAWGGRLVHFAQPGQPSWIWPGQPGEKDATLRWGGDKTYPGPHTLWRFTLPNAWPPPEPDTAPHVATVDVNTLTTKSPPWQAFGGARIIRTYRIEARQLHITHHITPVPGSSLPVCAWVITQCQPATAFLPLPKASPYKDHIFWYGGRKPGADVHFPRPDLLEIRPVTGLAFKLGTHPPRPAIAALREGQIFLQRASVPIRNPKTDTLEHLPADPTAQYPEGADGAGLSVEYYHHGQPPPLQYMELELLSPLRPARDGVELTTHWSLHPAGENPTATMHSLFHPIPTAP